MTTTDTAPPPLPTEVLRWPIDDIDPSPFQERRLFAAQPLQEMAESVKTHGIIQPLTGRRVGPGKKIELVCGERRLRSGKLAGLTEVPLILRELTDAQAENIVLTENIQREDLTPSEEARSYDRMLKLRDADGKAMHTRESVARLACKKLNHIDDHLKLLACPKELMQAVDEGKVTLSVAMVVGRIPDPKLRPQAAAMVLHPTYQEAPLIVSQAKQLVRENFMVSLAGAPWKLDDATLVPVKFEDFEGEKRRCFGGACQDCPFLSANIDGAQVTKNEGVRGKPVAGGASATLCTLPKCFKAKIDAVWALDREKALKKGLKVIDEAEAKKAFHPSKNETANSSKYVWLDANPQYHEVTSQAYYQVNGRKWRQLLKGSEIQVVVGRNPHTGRLVELSLISEAKPVAEKVLRARKPAEDPDKPKTPAQKKKEEDEKALRKEELQRKKVDEIALAEGLRDIFARIEEKGAGADALKRLFKIALARAGAHGVKFMGKHLEIEPVKGKYGMPDLDGPIMKWAEDHCGDRAVAWQAVISLALLSWSVGYHGFQSDDFEGVCAAMNIRLPELQRRGKALLEGEKKSKGSKPEEPAKKAGSDSSEPVNWSASKEADKTKAADARGKLAKAPVELLDEAGAAEEARRATNAKCLEASKAAGVTNEHRDFYYALPSGGGAINKLQERFGLGYDAAAKIVDCIIDERGTGLEMVRWAEDGKTKAADVLAASAAAGVLQTHRLYYFANPGATVAMVQSRFKVGFSQATKIHAALVAEEKASLGMFKEVEAQDAPAPAADAHPDLFAEPAAKAPDSGPSATEDLTGVQDSKLGKPERLSFDEQVALARKTSEWAVIIGPMPAKGAPGRKEWDALRVKVWKAAKKPVTK